MDYKFLGQEGLSFSEVSRLSNILQQRCENILAQISQYSNYTEVVNTPTGDVEKTTAYGVDKYFEIKVSRLANYRAIQAILLESSKERGKAIKEIEDRVLKYKELELPILKMSYIADKLIATPVQEHSWTGLTKEEYLQYTEANAKAGAIGSIIHKNGYLDNLRKEIATLYKDKLGTYIVGDITYITIKKMVNHDVDLETLHIELEKMHNENNKIVNYYKAKVEENFQNQMLFYKSETAKIYAEHDMELKRYNQQLAEQLAQKELHKRNALNEFEKQNIQDLQSIHELKISVLTDEQLNLINELV